MSLDRNQILKFSAASTFPREEVQAPDLGGSVFVRVLSAADRDAFERAAQADPHADFRARLMVASVCDPEGKPLFTAADLPSLNALPSTGLTPILEAAIRINKMGAGAAEAEAKNSESGPA